VLLQDVGERFVGQFLNGRHPVAPELLQFVEGFVIEGDQFAHRFLLLRRLTRVQTRRTRLVPRVSQMLDQANAADAAA
jgi:hypothetical protein